MGFPGWIKAPIVLSLVLLVISSTNGQIRCTERKYKSHNLSFYFNIFLYWLLTNFVSMKGLTGRFCPALMEIFGLVGPILTFAIKNVPEIFGVMESHQEVPTLLHLIQEFWV